MWARVTDQKPFAAVLVALVVIAWLSLWAWGESPYGRFIGHHNLEAVRGGGALILLFVAGWVVMVVAMMLPTSLPLLMLFQSFTRQRTRPMRLMGLLIAG